MKTFKAIVLMVVFVVVAFAAGYGIGYYQLKSAEKTWSAEKQQMQAKIASLEKELTVAKAREALREIPDNLGQVAMHIGEKNYGLAIKALDGIQETFLRIQPLLDEGTKKKFEFFLPALEETKKQADQVNPDTKKKVEELTSLFEQALKAPKKGMEEKKG